MTPTTNSPSLELRRLNAQEVARLFGVSTRTIYRWTERKAFPQPVARGKKYTRWDSRDVFEEFNKRRDCPSWT